MKRGKRVFNADPVGSGKSAMGLVAVEELKALPCIIVCPASMKLVWAREIEKWEPGRRVYVVRNGKDPIPKDMDYWIVNYDLCSRRLAELMALKYKSFIADECSALKNGTSQRSKACRAIAQQVEVRYLLSASPMPNGPVELVHQLVLLGRMIQFGTWHEYVHKWCAAKKRRIGHREILDVSGSSNLDSLRHKLLVEPGFGGTSAMLKRKKEDILPELPKEQVIRIPVELSNHGEYARARDAFKIWYRDWLKSKGRAAEVDGNEQELATILDRLANGGEPNAAVQANKLRQITGDGKVAAAVLWIMDHLEESEKRKLVVFCYHVDVGAKVLSGLRAGGIDSVSIFGDDGMQTRQNAIDAFQNNPETQVIVCSIMAAGMGITLTAASEVCFVETSYVPRDTSQGIGRVSRIGQQSDNIRAYMLHAAGTADEHLLAINERKRATVEKVLGAT